MLHWAKRAIRATKVASGRTWFGTLTVDEPSLAEMQARARLASTDPNAEWWDDVRPVTYWCRRRKREVTVSGHPCDERFRLVRDQLILETRRMWARLRKNGHQFKYFLVFERHKSGEPHMHVLVHEETATPILKRQLEEQWSWGYTNFKLVGSAKRQVAPEQAAFYVAKYLAKTTQARQIASKGYGRECGALVAIGNEGDRDARAQPGGLARSRVTRGPKGPV